MNNKYKILIIEDDSNIRSLLITLLDSNGYYTTAASSYREGILLAKSHNPDVILLDLGLPDGDGIDFIREVRDTYSTPIIVLSARGDEADKVTALDLGANDYVTKPFSSLELLARVRSVIRTLLHRADAGRLGERKFSIGDMTIDYDRRTVYLSGEDVKLTQIEYNILVLLSEQVGKVLTYSAIIKEIWGTADSGSTKKLQVNMANIRKKLGIKPGDDKYIVNELGIGYRMKDSE